MVTEMSEKLVAVDLFILSNWKILAKYFAHGIVFSIIFFMFGIVWALISVLLVVVGAWIGFLIAIVLLLLVIGFINSVVTGWLWFPVKMSFGDVFLHGLVLFIMYLILNFILVVMPSIHFPGIVTTIITLIVATFIYGFVGRKVGEFWKEALVEFKELEAEPSVSEVDAEELYNNLLSQYITHWGVTKGTALLESEIGAYARHGVSFSEAVRKVFERQKKS